jgi:hypothetical protein
MAELWVRSSGRPTAPVAALPPGRLGRGLPTLLTAACPGRTRPAGRAAAPPAGLGRPLAPAGRRVVAAGLVVVLAGAVLTGADAWFRHRRAAHLDAVVAAFADADCGAALEAWRQSTQDPAFPGRRVATPAGVDGAVATCRALEDADRLRDSGDAERAFAAYLVLRRSAPKSPIARKAIGPRLIAVLDGGAVTAKPRLCHDLRGAVDADLLAKDDAVPSVMTACGELLARADSDADKGCRVRPGQRRPREVPDVAGRAARCHRRGGFAAGRGPRRPAHGHDAVPRCGEGVRCRDRPLRQPLAVAGDADREGSRRRPRRQPACLPELWAVRPGHLLLAVHGKGASTSCRCRRPLRDGAAVQRRRPGSEPRLLGPATGRLRGVLLLHPVTTARVREATAR